jgi:hypothetical protein
VTESWLVVCSLGFPNTYQWDWTTIAALVARRPPLFANSDADKIFPMDGNRRVMAKLRKVYKMYDNPDLVDKYIGKGDHEDRADLRVTAFQWMNRRLKNDTRRWSTSRTSSCRAGAARLSRGEGLPQGRAQRQDRRDVREAGRGEAAGKRAVRGVEEGDAEGIAGEVLSGLAGEYPSGNLSAVSGRYGARYRQGHLLDAGSRQPDTH